MRHYGVASLAVLVLTLAACEKKAETPNAPSSEDAVAAATAVPQSPAASARVLPTEMPEVMRGRWGLVPADCTSTKGDAKGLITIDAGSIRFYESVAKLSKVKDADDDGLIATFAFTGEGQSWTLDMALEVEGDNNEKLERKDTGPDAAPGTLEYTRCS